MKKILILSLLLQFYISVARGSDKKKLHCSSQIAVVEKIIEQLNYQGYPDLYKYLAYTFWLPEVDGYPFHISESDSGRLQISVYRSAEGPKLGPPMTLAVRLCPKGNGEFLVKASYGLSIEVAVIIPEEEESESDKDVDLERPVTTISTKGKVRPEMMFEMKGALSGRYLLVDGAEDHEKELIEQLLIGEPEQRFEARQELIRLNKIHFQDI